MSPTTEFVVVVAILAAAVVALAALVPRWQEWRAHRLIELRCGTCGVVFHRPLSKCPPEYKSWIALCSACAVEECLVNAECPCCLAKIGGPGSVHRCDPLGVVTWGDVLAARDRRDAR